jgi:hypothetical protein
VDNLVEQEIPEFFGRYSVRALEKLLKPSVKSLMVRPHYPIMLITSVHTMNKTS